MCGRVRLPNGWLVIAGFSVITQYTLNLLSLHRQRHLLSFQPDVPTGVIDRGLRGRCPPHQERMHALLFGFGDLRYVHYLREAIIPRVAKNMRSHSIELAIKCIPKFGEDRIYGTERQRRTCAHGDEQEWVKSCALSGSACVRYVFVRQFAKAGGQRNLSITGLDQWLVLSRVFRIVCSPDHRQLLRLKVNVGNLYVQHFAATKAKLIEPPHQQSVSNACAFSFPRILRRCWRRNIEKSLRHLWLKPFPLPDGIPAFMTWQPRVQSIFAGRPFIPKPLTLSRTRVIASHVVSHQPIKIVADDPNTVSCGMARHLSWCRLSLNKAHTFPGDSSNGFLGRRN
ncbi:hypothetical protein ALQ31_06303 [Pseudomonas amygdali pv. morsprunorum]|nr:hypothetical protein ALQ45_05839 [Pseudomonas amygdali pv. morsprunorum]RMP00337.1 hypothetical protein ALQ31_06303 [Pseudomonas amygdali pv. morsprunorum]RMU25831.1 hypothetical protein ALP31_05725 [Pseudomonas amygdali pv. morsprunorum]